MAMADRTVLNTNEASGPLELRHATTDRATMVVVPRRRLFAIDGVGSPIAGDFQLAGQTLRAVWEALRVRMQRASRMEIRKPTLEVAWWTHPELPDDKMAEGFTDRSTWHWQQMMEIPGRATDADAAAAIEDRRRTANRDVALVRVIELVEGRAAQILLSATTDEQESVLRLYAAIRDAGLRPRGHLHQIHLGDPQQVRPDRRHSILRLPVEPTSEPAPGSMPEG
jgi:hypothetical protein